MKKLSLAAGALAAFGAATWLVMQWFTTDEQRVRRAVGHLVGRLEARDPAGFCQLLTEDYQDANGYDRLSMRVLLTRGLMHLATVRVRVDALEAAVAGDEATAEFTAYAVAEARDHGQQPPWRHQTLVRLRLRRAEGDWRVRHAEYALPEIVRRGGL